MRDIIDHIFLIKIIQGTLWDFENIGGIPFDDSYEVAKHNGDLFNATVNALVPGDTLLFPAGLNFFTTGGIVRRNMTGVTWQIDGNITFNDDREKWPYNDDGGIKECIYLTDSSDILFTSTNPNKGVIDGNGFIW